MLDRREALTGFGWLAVLGAPVLAGAADAAAVSPPGAKTRDELDLSTAAGNVTAMAKLTATLAADGYKHGWYSGVLMGVVPGEAVRELVGVIGMSTQRLRPAPEQGGYQLLQKECGFFTDLATGKVLERWTNPYLNEIVEPFHIANPAVNRWILPQVKEERFYDRVDGKEPPSRPFILPWQRAGDRLMLEQRTHFWANNPLDPAVWKRESSGARIQVSDCMSYNARWSELADPRRDSVEYDGHWVHVRPWQPWMLMGDRPGHCLYSAITGSALNASSVPPHIFELVRERLPDFLLPPAEVRKSEPSMIRFMRERKPAP
ncbi:MAG: DUF1838 domain-containing protein [Gammaproteobacteria bacterium]|nr:DUF1838 domain-containing protein [Gammaproteobacteria bacterium]